jgi:spore coat protein U-like protein
MKCYLRRPHPARCTVLLALLTAIAAPLSHAAVSNCTVTATSVAFGTYTPLQATALTGTGTITTVCTVTSHSNTITVDLTAGTSGTFTARTMTTVLGTTTYTLTYNLYQNAADTIIWGNGTGGSQADTVTLTRHGGNDTITTATTIYGAVAPSQDPAPGTYTDTITVSVNF